MGADCGGKVRHIPLGLTRVVTEINQLAITIASVLNHSTVDVRDFSKRAPDS